MPRVAGLNVVAVLVAAVAFYAVGMVFYGFAFMEVWGQEQLINHGADPATARTLTGTASWVNFYLGRDSRPGRPKDLWQTGGGPGRTVPIEEDERLKSAGPSAADKALAARTPPKPGGKVDARGTVEKVSA